MSLSHSPSIVRNGLLLYLDAANSRSYSGTGSTWNDLSGNGYNATIAGSNVWNSTFGGQFDFGNTAQTSNYIILPHQAAQATSNYYTVEFWMRPTAIATPTYFMSMATAANNNYYIMEVSTGNTIGRWVGSGSVSFTNNEIMQLCLVRDGSDTGNIYKNGTATVASPISLINGVDPGGWILNQEQDVVGGGFDPAQNFRGAFMGIKLYNRALSQSEIIQNFNALKGRYSV